MNTAKFLNGSSGSPLGAAGVIKSDSKKDGFLAEKRLVLRGKRIARADVGVMI